MKVLIPVIALIVVAVALAASSGLIFTQAPVGSGTGLAPDSMQEGSMGTDTGMMDSEGAGDSGAGGSGSEPLWLTAELTDVSTGETFRLSDFKGTPILLESFAVWCPICLSQQKEMEKLLSEDISVVHVSLDTDPNEDITNVISHLERNGFTWRFAVAPSEVTQSLREQFGLSVVNAPSAPVILIDRDLSPTLLRSGVKPASELLGYVRGA